MKRPIARATRVLVGAVLLLSLSSPVALAVDGVTEINDTSITAAGGYPFTIPASGSYVLTSNLTPPPGTTALMVGAPNVILDLNGFDIIGSLGGVGDGIAGGPAGMTVYNGSIEGFSGTGIIGGMGTKVLKTTISGNGVGIFVGPPNSQCLIVENVIRGNNEPGATNIGIEDAHHCKIENNVVSENDGGGIFGGGNVIVHNQILANGAGATQGGVLCFLGGCTIQENVIVLNSDYGISDTPGPAAGLPVPAPPGTPFPAPPTGGIGPPPNVILKNVINDNGGFGIYSNITNLVTDNQIVNNGLDGLVCGGVCTVRGNLITNNNTTGGSNGGATIGPGSTIHANTLSFNTGVGLVLAPTAAWSNNNAFGNTDPGADVSTTFPLTPGPPHPTSAFDNACTGGPAPAPRCP